MSRLQRESGGVLELCLETAAQIMCGLVATTYGFAFRNVPPDTVLAAETATQHAALEHTLQRIDIRIGLAVRILVVHDVRGSEGA
jgi:hypothetical protein